MEIIVIGNNVKNICDKINELTGKGNRILIMTEKERDRFDCELDDVFFAPLTKPYTIDKKEKEILYFSYHKKVVSGAHYLQGIIEFDKIYEV